MHIGFLTTEYGSLVSGGIGTSIQTLAHGLVAQGHRVTVVGWGTEATFDDAGVSVRFVAESRIPKMGWLLNRKAASSLINRLVREEGLEIVEAHDWTGPSAGMKLDCPVVIRCNGSASYFAHLLNEKVRPSVRTAERIALREAAGVIAVSRFTAEVTTQLFGLEREVGVIPNGIDMDRCPAGKNETSLPEADTILYFGTLVRKKGVLDLCRAFSVVADRNPHARLWLVGRDAADTRTGSSSTWSLCAEALSPAAMRRVEYVGGRPHDEVWTYIRKATICVFPSYAEAMPMAWLEAMACSKAVIAYDIGWASEVIESGTSGVLVRSGDTDGLAGNILRLLTASECVGELGRHARERVESLFDTRRTAQSSARWYQRVVAAQGA
jgi:glycosyltransferase involved in cell wall biosynthesis